MFVTYLCDWMFKYKCVAVPAAGGGGLPYSVMVL